MKDKIFQRLKQAYSHLGLGDVVLTSHAEALASTGFVTDENIETIVSGQKGFLEALQKSNDERVTNAVKKAKKDAEEEAKKKADELEAQRKKAEEEAKKKAEEEAERKRKEEEALAKKKAEEEAERKRKEELEKNNEIPQWFKDMQAKQEEEAKKKEEAYEARIAQLLAQAKTDGESFNTQLKAQTEAYNALKASHDKMIEEANVEKATKAKQARAEMILSMAKELGIPQSRIDEGFSIADDATEETITTYLTKVATNSKANEMPRVSPFKMSDSTPTKEEVGKVAEALIK